MAMAPLFALLVALGGTGAALIYHLGGRIDNILRENYDSVVYMRDLNESLERMDSSFQFALAGRENEAREQYETSWRRYAQALSKEQHNITLPGEAELVATLTALSDNYRRQGQEFFKRSGQPRDEPLLQRAETAGALWQVPRDQGTFQGRSCSSTRTTWKRSPGRPAAWPVPR